MKCGHCGKVGLSPPVACVVVYAPSLPDGLYCLLPAGDYCLCDSCEAPLVFVNKAMASHPKTRSADDWTEATIVFNTARVKPWMLDRQRNAKGIAQA